MQGSVFYFSWMSSEKSGLGASEVKGSENQFDSVQFL